MGWDQGEEEASLHAGVNGGFFFSIFLKKLFYFPFVHCMPLQPPGERKLEPCMHVPAGLLLFSRACVRHKILFHASAHAWINVHPTILFIN
jgi:hypothetical protein